ncbi:hypothetical protein AB6A40_000372 [Gnathostoma spinigerum]|uniref:tRNA (uracil-O(2)-)-methyltransferase n=1 Tax=Gnathostoma spinigerum TaxID=75299 RepID=A0ABD6EAA4_9BILA
MMWNDSVKLLFQNSDMNDTFLSDEVPLPTNVDKVLLFQKLIDIWREHCDAINRRIACITVVDPNCDEFLRVTNSLDHVNGHEIELRKFIPKSPFFSEKAYEASFLSGESQAEFLPLCLDERPHPHVSFAYKISLDVHSDCNSCMGTLTVSCSENVDENVWIFKQAFPNLLRWLKNIDLSRTSTQSHRLIDAEKYTKLYMHIKNALGKEICMNWTERTDPQKFVFEDCAISAYLQELWSSYGIKPRRFCDVGCGNGLLVYLLCKQNITGFGIDVRRRNIWDSFVGAELVERSLNPERDCISDADFFIGNHSDEMTPWIPILAARNCCAFFLLPCCPYDFFGKYTRKKEDTGSSTYLAYLSYIRRICIRLGFDVKEDRLKIPSTKRHCFFCTIPASGLSSEISSVIADLLANKSQFFMPRSKIISVQGYSKLSPTFRQSLTLKIFNFLLQTGDPSGSAWPAGNEVDILDITALLSPDEKSRLKKSDGGVQTFLKNQHQVFKVMGGKVRIRRWSSESTSTSNKKKTQQCWFHLHHPNGCPLPADICSYIH